MNKSIIFGATLVLGLVCGEHGSLANLLQGSGEAHRHPSLSDVREQIRLEEIAEVVLDKNAARENRTRSRDGRYEAFTLYHPDDSPNFRLYFVERATRKVYEIGGLPLAHRPFSDLGWVSNRTLVFDRWSQPHYGIHYVVNVKAKKLVSALAFPDEFYLEQQKLKVKKGDL